MIGLASHGKIPHPARWRYNCRMTTSIDVTVNGHQKTLDDDVTAEKLVHLMGCADQRIAVEINGHIVPRSTLGERQIASGDKIEIVRAVGGG